MSGDPRNPHPGALEQSSVAGGDVSVSGLPVQGCPGEEATPQYWRERAEGTRALALRETSDIRGKLLEIAAAYDELADRAEAKRTH